MSSRIGASTQKKGIHNSLRAIFGRSSSHLSTSSTSSPQPETRASFSAEAPSEAVTPNPASTTRPSNSERLVTPHSKSAPSAINTGAADPQPRLPLTDGPGALDAAETTATITNVVWAGLKSSLQGLRDHSGMFPGLSMVAGILLECFNGIEMAARNQEDYEDLARELTTLNASLAGYVNAPTPLAPSVTKGISSIISEMKQQAGEVKKKTRGAGGRFLVAKADEEDVIRRYRRIQWLFRQLQANLSMSAWSIAYEDLVNIGLEALKPVEAATFDSALSSIVSRRKCTEGTRKQILSNLENWLVESDIPIVYWMNGMAGTGKTTIAYTFSERLKHRERLAASFFCTRASVGCCSVVRIIPTIAYQLARYSIPFQSALYEILDKESNIGSEPVEKQFERLLSGPLKKVKDAMPDNLVVVIDALDECSDHTGVETILDMLLRYAKYLPLKFLVTSRPKPEIYKRMMLDGNARAALHVHDIETSLVQADIELYLKKELSFMSPTPSQVEQLAQRSGSLFIYAATLVRYIRFGERFVDPHQRLQSVLSLTPEPTKGHAEIDVLYAAILQLALEEAQMRGQEAQDVKLVLRTVLFAQEPITVGTIAVLAGLEADIYRVHFALRLLRSVLHQSAYTDLELVSTFHASFPDFMLSSDRSKSFCFDIVDPHGDCTVEHDYNLITVTTPSGTTAQTTVDPSLALPTNPHSLPAPYYRAGPFAPVHAVREREWERLENEAREREKEKGTQVVKRKEREPEEPEKNGKPGNNSKRTKVVPRGGMEEVPYGGNDRSVSNQPANTGDMLSGMAHRTQVAGGPSIVQKQQSSKLAHGSHPAAQSQSGLNHIKSLAPDSIILGGLFQSSIQLPPVQNVQTVRSGEMTPLGMLECLIGHGCSDLRLFVDPDRYSSCRVAEGGFGDVWKGQLVDGTSIAIKVLRYGLVYEDESKSVKRAMREIYNWSKLEHKNIHKLLGVTMFQERLGMVSVWMEHGTLRQYLQQHYNVDRYALCCQIAEGVAYLHSMDMIHGDLKACNILVSADGVLKLTDFDYSIISGHSLVFSATTRAGGGSLRWMAPELLLATDENPAERNKQTDVYALGMTFLETITNKAPYSECRHDHLLYGKHNRKEQPIRPMEHFPDVWWGNRMWNFLIKCWDYNPTSRPTADDVLAFLLQLANGVTTSTF